MCLLFRTDWPGMQLCAAVVVFAASLPHAVVGHPVGSLHTEHQILDEGNLRGKNRNIKTSKSRKAWDTESKHNTRSHTPSEPELVVVNMFPNGKKKKQSQHMIYAAPTHWYKHTGHRDTTIHDCTIPNDLLYWSGKMKDVRLITKVTEEQEKTDFSSALKVKLSLQLQTRSQLTHKLCH